MITKITRLYLPVLMLFVFRLVNLTGQEINVTTKFDTSKIYIGDQINFSVIVDQPARLQLPFPLFRDTLAKNIEILSGPVVDTTAVTDSLVRITGRYLVTSFDSGFYMVNPVYVELRNESGVKRYYSDYSILEVARVKITPPDTAAKIFDIIGPYRAPLTLGEIMPWILLGFLAAAIIWLAVRFGKKLGRKKKEIPGVTISEPAHVIAFRELERLKDEKLWQSGETKKYYTRLTEILRKYLENRFSVFSLEMTTSETLDALIRTGFRKDDSYALLKSVLNGADLVKFAKYKPEASENDIHFENAWKFVSNTKKEEITGQPASGDDLNKDSRI
jgi:hypothetical protein